jgi:hypothetical protein
LKAVSPSWSKTVAQSAGFEAMPEWLQEPVLAGAISLAEAHSLWDHVLQQTRDVEMLPASMDSVAERMFLFELEMAGTAQ